METFLDGGLFELLLGILFASVLNIIFLKKYLLIIFSVLIISGPVTLLFINKDELYYWIVSLCLFNSVLLIILLWRQKNKNPGEALFNLVIMKKKLHEVWNKINNFFQRS
ncbi:MAG: hypothetical protein ABIO81_13460 [Ginsengibacter sp.]